MYEEREEGQYAPISLLHICMSLKDLCGRGGRRKGLSWEHCLGARRMCSCLLDANN